MTEPWNNDPIIDRQEESPAPWEGDPVVQSADPERPWESDALVSDTDADPSAVSTFFSELAGPTLLGGVRDAVQSVIDLPEDLGITGELPDLPEVAEPTTTGGRMARDVTQFLTGFVPVFGWLGKAGSAARLGGVARGALAGGVADFAVFDGQEERLSNLVQEHPSLANPVTEFLASDPDDAAALGRLKNTLEGAALGSLADGLVSGLRTMRAARAGRRAVQEGASPQTVKEVIEREAKEGPVFTVESAAGAAGTEASPSPRPAVNAVEAPSAATGMTPEDVLAPSSPQFQVRAAGRNAEESTRLVRVAETINLDRIDDEESLKAALDNMARFEGGFAEARAAGREAGEATTQAARDLLLVSTQRLVDRARAAMGGSDEALYDFLAAGTQHRAIQEFAAQKASEASAQLRAYKQMRSAGGADLKQVRQVIEQMGGRDMGEKKAALLSTIDDLEGANVAAKKMWEATTTDKVLEAWRAGLLTGFRTHGANLGSNALVTAYTVPERMLGGAFGALSGGERIQVQEGLAFASGAWKAMRKASSDAWQVLWREGVGEDAGPQGVLRRVPGLTDDPLPSGAFKSQDVGRRRAIGGDSGWWVRTPFRGLDAADVWFKIVNAGGEAEALALRKAMKEGLEGQPLRERVAQILSNLNEHPDILDAANKRADANTFTTPLHEQEGAIVDLAESISKFTARHPAFGFVAPFIRTPANILKFAGERSPAGFLMKDMQTALKAGGAERQEALAKITLGSSLMGTMAGYALQGRITGHGPTNPQERSAWRRTGKQPYSVKIGDTWYSYARFEPLGTLIGVAADMVDVFKNAGKDDFDDLALAGVTAAANVMTNKTFMQGPASLIQALEDPERFGDRFIEMLGGSTVPTVVADTARAVDPTLRDVRNIMDAWLNRVPGASGSLEPLLNLWGEEIKREGGAVGQMLNPVYVSKDGKDPISEMMLQVDYHPGMPGRQINGHELTPEQYTEYVKLAGQPAKRVLGKLVASDGWQQLPDYVKAERMEAVISQFRRVARLRMIGQHQELAVPARIEEEQEVLQQPAGPETSARTPDETEMVAAAHGLSRWFGGPKPKRTPSVPAVGATLENAAKGVLKAERVTPAPQPKEIDPDRALRLARDPDRLLGAMVEDGGPLATADPEAFAEQMQVAQRAAAYLAAQAPSRYVDPGPHAPAPDLPEYEQAAWQRTVAAAVDPLSVIEQLGRGEVNDEGLETVRTLYPATFARFQAEMASALAERKEAPSYERRLMLGRILGAGVEPTLQPRFMAAIQSTFAQQGPQTQGMPGTFPKRNGSQTLTWRQARRKSRNVSLAMESQQGDAAELQTPVQQVSQGPV